MSEFSRTWQEFGDVVGFAVYDHPAGVFGVVLGDFLAGQLAGHIESIQE